VSEGGYFDGNPSIGGTEWKKRRIKRYVTHYHYNVAEQLAKIEIQLKGGHYSHSAPIIMADELIAHCHP